MPDLLDPAVLATLRAYGWISAVLATLLGALVLIGWAAGIPALVSVLPGLAAMAPTTAVAFILAGLSLAARRLRRPGTSRALAMPVLLGSIAVIAGYIGTWGWKDTVGPWLLPVLDALGSNPATPPAPATAFGFLLLGTALLLMGRGCRSERAAIACASTGLLLSAMALLGYAYGAQGFYAMAVFDTIALSTAAGLLVLFLACLLHEPEHGWGAFIASKGPGGAAVRVQLLLTTVLPFATGFLVLRAMRAGALAPSAAVSLLVTATMVPIVLRILFDGRLLEDIDTQRLRAATAAHIRTTALEDEVRAGTSRLAASEARLDSYFEHTPEGLAVLQLGQDGVFTFDTVNPAFRAMYGIGPEPLQGERLRRFTTPEVAEDIEQRLHDCLTSNQVLSYTARRPLDGQARIMDVVLAPVPQTRPGGTRYVFASTRDVTEAHLRDDQLRQSQKMEAIGQLTGGVAHDFNNLLTGITGALELLQARIADGRTQDAPRYIAAAQGAARRAAALTHRLLAFSRQQTLDPQPTGLNRLVSGMEDLVRRTVGPAIAVEVVTAGGLWATLVDPNQLENALLNLCINARDAMPEGGRLVIETANRWLDDRAAAASDLPPGQYVSLCVSDSGTGMPPEIVARAFDPFFTTKPPGSGTGLGLSMTYGFVRQSGGQARIYSEPGQGTMVCLYLPRHMGAVPEPEAAADPTPPAAKSRTGRTVLVVDDDVTVRMLVRDVLIELGHGVLEAGDGPAALQVLQSNAPLDVLVTDVGLPGGLNGRQVAEAARAARPALPILFITGYAENAVLNHGHLDPGMRVLTKPFTMAALVRRITDLAGTAPVPPA